MSRTSPDLSKWKFEQSFRVRPDEAGLRLDSFLRARLPFRSREHLKARIREGAVRVNGGTAKVSKAVGRGDEVVVRLKRMGDEFDPADVPLVVVYEDEVIVALDKPPGFVVHPVGRHQMDTIVNALHLRYRKPHSPDEDVVPKLAHRLDQFTSGVLLVAKRDDVRADLGRQFAERKIEKEYLAIVEGVPDPLTGEIEAPIGRNLVMRNGLPMVVRDDGEPSLTVYEVEEALATHSLVRLFPHSGRTHQIRVHMSFLGHPLVADPLYGDGKPLEIDGKARIDRYPLHSAAITFTHPVTGKRQTIKAPMHDDMQRAIRALRRRAGRDQRAG